MIAQYIQQATFIQQLNQVLVKMSMLKNLKNKDSKKDAKKDTKGKKDTKEVSKVQQDQEQEQTIDLVDDTELKPEQGKQKQVIKKKNDYQLQEKQIDVSNINLNKVEKPKERTTWVANTVQEVNKKDFKMESIDHEFMSLTDQEFNQKQKQKLLEKQKQQQDKPKIIEQNGFNYAPLQKTADQLKMQRADQQIQFKSGNTSIGAKIGESTGPAINFTNSGMNKQFAPLQKSAQQLKMEQAERRQQQEAAKKPAATSWIGVKKNVPTTQSDQKPVFKTSAWVTMAEQNMGSNVGSDIKFAPLNNDAPKQIKKQQPKTTKPEAKQSSWAASNVQQQNGMKFAPLQLSKQEQRMREAERKQQQFVFVSKKDQQQRKKRREQKQKANQAAQFGQKI